MTPAATTPAARGSKGGAGSRTQDGSGTGHRRTVRKPSVPRRVSGPAAGATRTRPAPESPRTAPRRPSRRPAPARRRAPLTARARAFVVGLPDHALLDRIVRGRAWIPILGVLLAGIVAMQVEVLKLNASMGRSLERGTALASRNQQLRASVSALSDDARIERLAAQQGMIMPAPQAVTFMSPGGASAAARAAHNIHAPDGSAFIAALPSVDTPAGAAAAAGTTSASSGTTSAGTTVGTSVGTSSTAATTVAPTTSSATTTPVAPTTSSPATATATPSTGG